MSYKTATRINLTSSDEALLVYEIVHGSKAYGTETQSSDTDIRGVYIPSQEYIYRLGIKKDFINKTEGDIDTVYHSLNKFGWLLYKNNPNILEWLFVPEDCIRVMSVDFFEKIRRNRNFFVSKKVYHTFRGFANSEFSKLDTIHGKLGDKRKQLIKEYGYNTKSAMNVMRLLDSATSLLRGEGITMPFPEADMYLRIKLGDLPKKEVQSMAIDKFARLDKAFIESELPEEVDLDVMNEFILSLMKSAHDSPNFKPMD